MEWNYCALDLEMKNPHLLNDGNWKTLNVKEVPVNKKFKRKSREPVKRVSEVKSSKNDSKLDEDLNGDPVENSFVLNSQKRLQAIASVVSGDHIEQLGISDTALDMRINALPAISGKVPCYSYGQKLSKLAILRIACNYILSLAQLADLDYTPDHSNMSFRECVEQCTRTLQAEGRSKKRKE